MLVAFDIVGGDDELLAFLKLDLVLALGVFLNQPQRIFGPWRSTWRRRTTVALEAARTLL